jgi:hypothetical protein
MPQIALGRAGELISGTLAAVADEERALVEVRMAAEMCGLTQGGIRAACRRGELDVVALGPTGPYGRRRWLLDLDQVVAWQRARGWPLAPAADAISLALAGDLRVALDRVLAIAALSRPEAERSRLIDERRRVAAARAQLLAGR